MKKALLTFSILFITCSGFCQTIDTTALLLMQKSWDKLAAMKDISYKMTKVDTMVRENHFEVNRVMVEGTVKRNSYWLLRLENNAEWLVKQDTLFKKEKPDAESIIFTTAWERHKIASCNIYNILGTERPVIDNDMLSLQFVKDVTNPGFYVIHMVSKVAYQTDEIQGILRYDRYFIDKKSLLATRRIQYGKSLQQGKEAVDIYDFSVLINPNENHFDLNKFFNAPLIQEKNRFETLKVGSIAPGFLAREVRTGKPVSLERFKGKVVLLDFWYLSCMPCRILMPKLQKLQEKFDKDKVVVIGVNVRDNNPVEIVEFLKKQQILYSQVYQPGQLLTWDYKLQAFPTTLVIDKEGKIKLAEIGLGDDTDMKLEQEVRKALLK